MKVMKLLGLLLGSILIAQSFLTACPTFLYDLQHKEKFNYNDELEGEMGETEGYDDFDYENQE